MHSTIYYLSPDRASPGVSALVADGLLGGGFLLLIVYAWVWRRIHHHRGVAASLAEHDGRGTFLGGTVITGRVELDPGEGAAVTVEIIQAGAEHQRKNGWSHSWTEVSRSVEARPFYLIRPSGERVRVEPGERVLLIDRLDDGQRVFEKDEVIPRRWCRRARVSNGDTVWAAGVLERAGAPGGGAYRDAPSESTLRPPRTGRMLISTEPLEQRLYRRARLHLGWALGLMVCFGLLHGVLLRDYHRLRWSGETVTAGDLRADEHSVWHSPSRGRSGYFSKYYTLDGTTLYRGARRRLSDQVSWTAWGAVESKSITEAPFVIARARPELHQIGDQPSLDLQLVIPLSICFVLLALAYRISVKNTRPWYERRVVDYGPGRLC